MLANVRCSTLGLCVAPPLQCHNHLITADAGLQCSIALPQYHRNFKWSPSFRVSHRVGVTWDFSWNITTDFSLLLRYFLSQSHHSPTKPWQIYLCLIVSRCSQECPKRETLTQKFVVESWSWPRRAITGSNFSKEFASGFYGNGLWDSVGTVWDQYMGTTVLVQRFGRQKRNSYCRLWDWVALPSLLLVNQWNRIETSEIDLHQYTIDSQGKC